MFGRAAQKLTLLSSLVIAPLATGCTATLYEEDVVYVRHHHHGHVAFHQAPDLVYVGDGVYVVRDCDTAVYYVDGSYYTYDDGVWYSSSYWASPWAVATIGFVPVHLHHMHHHHYVHYHGGHDAHVVKAPSHDLDHTAAAPSHGGHQAASASAEASGSHTKSSKTKIKSIDGAQGRGAAAIAPSAPAGRSGGNPFEQSQAGGRADTKSGKASFDVKKGSTVPRSSTPTTSARPSDDADRPSMSAPTNASTARSASPDRPSTTKTATTKPAPSKVSKKSSPSRKKKSRR